MKIGKRPAYAGPLNALSHLERTPIAATLVVVLAIAVILLGLILADLVDRHADLLLREQLSCQVPPGRYVIGWIDTSNGGQRVRCHVMDAAGSQSHKPRTRLPLKKNT